MMVRQDADDESEWREEANQTSCVSLLVMLGDRKGAFSVIGEWLGMSLKERNRSASFSMQWN